MDDLKDAVNAANKAEALAVVWPVTELADKNRGMAEMFSSEASISGEIHADCAAKPASSNL